MRRQSSSPSVVALCVFHLSEKLIRRCQQAKIVGMMPVNGGREIISFEVGELQSVGNFELRDCFKHSARAAKNVSVHVVCVRYFWSETHIGTGILESFGGTAGVFVTVNQEMAGSEIIGTCSQDSFKERDGADHATLAISEGIRLF